MQMKDPYKFERQFRNKKQIQTHHLMTLSSLRPFVRASAVSWTFLGFLSEMCQ